MQRSLLPRTRPRMAGLEIGAIYESSALVGVGGDIYDYLQTDDDRLAIVLGDVTGHGIDAAADMAMAKFVFRSLARLYPEPGAFLGAANDVVVEEIGAGKFITMLYLTIDLGRGEVACASGGHPPPRLLDAGRRASTSLDAKGLVLGIEPGHRVQRAAAAVRARLLGRPLHRRPRRGAPAPARCTARSGSTACSPPTHELPAEQLAAVALEECRRWVGGDLRDDCAIVVVRGAT